MLYFVEVLLILPVAYFVPVGMLWAFFRYRPGRREVLALIAVCTPALQLIYMLMPEAQYIMLRSVLAGGVMAAAAMAVLQASLLRRAIAVCVGLFLMLLGEFCSFLFLETVFPGLIDPTNRERTLRLNLIPFGVPYVVALLVVALQRLWKIGHGGWRLGRLWRVLLWVAPSMLLSSAITVGLEVEKIAHFGLGQFAFRPLFIHTFAMIFSALITCGVLVVVAVDESRKSEALMRYQQTIANQYDSTRIFRHNYKNTLLMLNGYYREGAYQDMGELLHRMNDVYNAVYSSEYAAGVEALEDPGIKWLVISKLVHGQSLGINCAVRVSGPLRAEGLTTADLSEILGILLDNAIDCAAETHAKLMGMDIDSDGGTLVIAVRNSVDEPPDLTRIFQKGYTTKRDHTGLGLYRLHQLLRRHEHALIDAKLVEGMFILSVSI